MTSQEFEHIATELRPRLKTIGRQFFGDDDAAEDIAQETLMRLWMLRHRIDLCVSEWRRRQVRLSTTLCKESADTESIEHRLELREEVERLRKAIGQLKPSEQRLFRMRYEAEMDIPQIVAATGIGERSVSAMLSTAKRKLSELYKKGGQV